MSRALRIAVFAALTAAGTVVGGWWSVPVLAVLWVRVLPSDRHGVANSAIGAAIGWLVLLGIAALHGPVATVARVLSAVLELPPWGFFLATLLFPAALAALAAILTRPASGT